MKEQFEMFGKPPEPSVPEKEKPHQPTAEDLEFAAGKKLIDTGRAAQGNRSEHEKWKAAMIGLYGDPFLFDRKPTGKHGEQGKIFSSKDKDKPVA
jgi:hypothetical protein